MTYISIGVHGVTYLKGGRRTCHWVVILITMVTIDGNPRVAHIFGGAIPRTVLLIKQIRLHYRQTLQAYSMHFLFEVLCLEVD